MAKAINVHVKILTQPVTPLDDILQETRSVFVGAGINMNLISVDTLDVTDPQIEPFNFLDVGLCGSHVLSKEQTGLSRLRGNVPKKDIVIFICNFLSISGFSIDGCASFNPDSPMAVIAHYCPLYTLAHEVGHVLGLPHVNANNRLMTLAGTASIIPPPIFDPGEVTLMGQSPFCNNN